MDATRRFLSAVQTWLDVGAGSDNVVRYCARDEGGHKAVAESLANCEHAAAEVIDVGNEAVHELTAAGCRDEARLAARIVHLAGRPFGWRTVAGNWPDDAAALHVAATAPGFSPRTSTAPPTLAHANDRKIRGGTLRLRRALSELRALVEGNPPHSPLAWGYRALDEIAPMARAAGVPSPIVLMTAGDLAHDGALPDDPGDLAGVIQLRTPRGDDVGGWELRKNSPTPGLREALLDCIAAWLAWIDAQDVPTADLSPPALNGDNSRENAGSAPDRTPEKTPKKTPKYFGPLAVLPVCDGPLCAKCRSFVENGSLLEARLLIDGDRRRLLDDLPHWRELRHFGRLRWGRSEFDANPIELLLDWLAAEHAKPAHDALFTPRVEVVDLLRAAVAGSDGARPSAGVLTELLAGSDRLTVPSCADWLERFGEVAPATLDGWRTLAVRCGVDPNELLSGSLTLRELVAIGEGYFLNRADAKAGTSTAPAAAGLDDPSPAAETAPAPVAERTEGTAKPPRRQKLAYYAFKYVETKLGRRVEDREAYEYLQEYGIENENAGELIDYDLPDRFDTWLSYLSAGRKAFDDSKYTPRHARRSGGSVVRAADVQLTKRDG